MTLHDWRRKEEQIISRLEKLRRARKRAITAMRAMSMGVQIDHLRIELSRHRRNYPKMRITECD